MKTFLTGATGHVGRTLLPVLIEAGHQVIGLTRSEQGARLLAAAGAEVCRGQLEDLNTLREATSGVDGVIHCAFNNDAPQSEVGNKQDTQAIEAIGTALLGSNRPLLITSVVGMGLRAPNELATEDHFDPKDRFHAMRGSELAGAALSDRGVNVSVVRLPQVHDKTKQGLASALIRVARAKKVSVYVGEGHNRWAAGHVTDIAQLYRLVLERQVAGSRYNAVAEEGIPLRAIAEVIGRGLSLPVVSVTNEEAQVHFGPLAVLVGADMPASGAQTQRSLDWHPVGPGLLHDLSQLKFE